LVEDVVRLLAPQPDDLIIDGTLGGGGHAHALLTAQPAATLIGIDRDPAALAAAERRLAPVAGRVHLVHGSYADIPEHLRSLGFEAADAVLLDLGMSSLQLDDPSRGFSFRREGPLDMRMDPSSAVSAATLVNESSPDELLAILRSYGEERHARRIISAIERRRQTKPIETTTELAETVRRAVPQRHHRPGLDAATRTFQALRIAVNRELEALDRGMPAVWSILRPGGRFAIISFHSLEDRPVKQFFRRMADPCICPRDLPECLCGRTPEAAILTPRPIRPSAEEIEANPRSRSARLRAAQVLPQVP
jgi:16S rRNA (cytosine1402-N4)-methyltransferase